MPGNKTVQYIVMALKAGAVIIGLWLFFRYVFSWILPFLIAFLAAYMLETPIVRMRRRWRIKRCFLSASMTVLLYGTAALLVYLAIYRLGTEIPGIMTRLGRLSERVPALIAELGARMTGLIDSFPEPVRNFLNGLNIDELLSQMSIPRDALSGVVEFGKSFAKGLPPAALFVAAAMLSTYFISADFPRISSFLWSQIPEKRRDSIRRTRSQLGDTFCKWLKAQLMLMGITFLLLCAGLMLLRIRYAILLAAGIALIDALPLLGTAAILIPWALIAYLSGDTAASISLAVLAVIVSAARGIAEPRLVGAQIGLHPLVTLISMYIGFRTTGIIGMILFPMAALILIKFQEWGYIKIWKTDEAGERARTHP